MGGMGDLDGDGLADLAVGSRGSGDVRIFHGGTPSLDRCASVTLPTFRHLYQPRTGARSASRTRDSVANPARSSTTSPG